MKNESMVIRLFYIFVPLLFVGTLVGQNISCPSSIKISNNQVYLTWTAPASPPSFSNTIQIQVNLFENNGTNTCSGLFTFNHIISVCPFSQSIKQDFDFLKGQHRIDLNFC
jgi:hypothetical protein